MDFEDIPLEQATIPSGLPTLGQGSHPAGSTTPCAMEAASWLSGAPWSDHPRSVHPVIAAIARQVNDTLDDERRQELWPLILASLDTARPRHLLLHRRLLRFARHEVQSVAVTVATWQAMLERFALLSGSEIRALSRLSASQTAHSLLEHRAPFNPSIRDK